MGATYQVGVRSSKRVQNGLEAGACYINAELSEIGRIIASYEPALAYLSNTE
jgi:hypothetical protein